jgi:hypothetical protein
MVMEKTKEQQQQQQQEGDDDDWGWWFIGSVSLADRNRCARDLKRIAKHRVSMH